MNKLTSLFPFVCVGAALFLNACGREQHSIYSEHADWIKECPFPYSCQLAEAPDGSTAIRFEWRAKDYDGSRKTTGAEYRTKYYTASDRFNKNREAWIGFSVYFPADSMSADQHPAIITQTHGVPDFDLGEGWLIWTAGLSCVNGALIYSYSGDTRQVTPSTPNVEEFTHPGGKIPLGPIEFDRWHRFVYHHKFDLTGKGLIEIWHNGKQYSRNNIVLGYNDERGPFWKFGFYPYEGKSDHDSRVIFFDDVKVMLGEGSFAQVAPPGAVAANPGASGYDGSNAQTGVSARNGS